MRSREFIFPPITSPHADSYPFELSFVKSNLLARGLWKSTFISNLSCKKVIFLNYFKTCRKMMVFNHASFDPFFFC